jgi:cytochrome c biogenesis protein CcmG/thiol:disulfide interchange protein DsbE
VLQRRARHRSRRRAVAVFTVAGAVLGATIAAWPGSPSVDRHTVVVTPAPAPPATVALPSPLLDLPAPPLRGPALDGGAVQLAQLRGKSVFVEFFSVGEAASQQLQATLVTFRAGHPATSHVAVVGVLVARTSAAAPSLRASGVDWPVVADPTRHIALAWRVTTTPDTFFVDATGTVRAELVGAVPLTTLDALSNPPGGPTGHIRVASSFGTSPGYVDGVDMWVADQLGGPALAPVHDNLGHIVGYFEVGNLGYVPLAIVEHPEQFAALVRCDDELEQLLNDVDAINRGGTVTGSCAATLATDGVRVPAPLQARALGAPIRTVTVPNVVGEPVNDAEAQLQELAFLIFVDPNPSGSGPRRIVTSQEPPSGTTVDAPGAVRLRFTP